MNKRYDTTSALVRYIAGVFSIVAFILLFGTILYTNGGQHLKFAEVFFGTNDVNAPHVYGFVGQVLILLGGLFGILIPIFSGLVEKEKPLSFVTGAVLIVAAILVVSLRVLYPVIEGATEFSNYHLYGTTIAAAVLGFCAGVFNIWAAFIKE
jgi:hypothetical protein